MSNCLDVVEKDVEKVLNKFNEANQHYDKTFDELIAQIQNYQRDFETLTGMSYFCCFN